MVKAGLWPIPNNTYYMSLVKIKPILTKITAFAAMVLMILAGPAYFTHAQDAPTITWSKNAQGNWRFDSTYASQYPFAYWIDSRGLGSEGPVPHPDNTNVPTSVKMELLVADTGTHPFSDPCSTSTFTGDAEADLSCVAAAISAQGYSYTIGTSPDPSTLPPASPPKPQLPAPCVCP
jgi:hypothetical protein